MSETLALYETDTAAPAQPTFAALDAPTGGATSERLSISVNVTNDRLLLALDKKQAVSLFFALDANIGRFREKRESYRAALAAEPFHAAQNECAIAEFTDELRTLWGLYADVAVFAGYPPVRSFEEREAGQDEANAAWAAFAEAGEPKC